MSSSFACARLNSDGERIVAVCERFVAGRTPSELRSCDIRRARQIRVGNGECPSTFRENFSYLNSGQSGVRKPIIASSKNLSASVVESPSEAARICPAVPRILFHALANSSVLIKSGHQTYGVEFRW